MRNGWLREIKQWHQLAYAHLPCVFAEHVNELKSNGITERLSDARHAGRLFTFDVGVHDRLAARRSRLALGLRDKVKDR